MGYIYAGCSAEELLNRRNNGEFIETMAIVNAAEQAIPESGSRDLRNTSKTSYTTESGGKIGMEIHMDGSYTCNINGQVVEGSCPFL